MFVNAIMYYKVANAIHAVANVDDYSGSSRLLAATTLRNVLGTMTLGEILSQRETVATEMKVILLLAIRVVTHYSPGNFRCCYRALGGQGGEGGGEGRQGAGAVDEGHGC